jgi:selenide,water dikinase
LVAELAAHEPAALVSGLRSFDDGAVLELTPDLALVSSIDAFVPMVDDPADFGAIVAAHALGNVLAMGARPVLAVDLIAVPEGLGEAAVATIVGAAADVVAGAGAVLGGGHTVHADELLFGLAVQGVVHPDRVWTKAGARPGDAVVVAKRLGSGLVLAAGSSADQRRAIDALRVPNVAAVAALERWGARVHAVTDVAGFGLAGAAWEVAQRSGRAIEIDLARVPLYRGALAAAQEGVRTAGEAANRDYVAAHLVSSADAAREAVAFDPQVSGGLLACIDPGLAIQAVEAGFVVVGEVQDRLPGVRLT